MKSNFEFGKDTLPMSHLHFPFLYSLTVDPTSAYMTLRKIAD